MIDRSPAFLKALLEGNLEIAKELLSTGLDINLRFSPNSWTALHQAAELGDARAVRWLIENGANPNERDAFGQTPLHIAIDAEADSAKQEYVRTGVLSLSAEITELLLENGADPNAKTDAGKTPLSWATSMNHTKAIELLKAHGACQT